MSDMNGDIPTMQDGEQQPLAREAHSRSVPTQSRSTQTIQGQLILQSLGPNGTHLVVSLCSCLADECPSVRNDVDGIVDTIHCGLLAPLMMD